MASYYCSIVTLCLCGIVELQAAEVSRNVKSNAQQKGFARGVFMHVSASIRDAANVFLNGHRNLWLSRRG